MKIIAFRKYNPFSISSASANRFLSLIHGLKNLGVQVNILITGGYFSEEEKSKFQKKGSYNGINYHYLIAIKNTNIWFRRANTYLFKPLIQRIIIKRSKREIERFGSAIVWLTEEIEHQKAVNDLFGNKRFFFFVEQNEYLDIHKTNTGNVFSRQIGDEIKELFERITFPQLDGMALMTRNLLNHYRSFPLPHPKFLHLPMTVDLDRFKLATVYRIFDNSKKPYIAYIGVMSNLKDGLSILIDAFDLISPVFQDIDLFLFGPWDYDVPIINNQIERKGLQQRIKYLGPINKDQIPSLLINAKLLVLPRPNSKQAEGGFPTKLGEYLASGNPVCATKVGEIPDYLKDEESAFLAEPGSVNSFANAMRRALENPEKARKIGLNGRKVAESVFSKDVQAKRLHDFFCENFRENKSFEGKSTV